MYPTLNMRTEMGVGSMKRLSRENTSPCGILDMDNFLRAILSYRNTPGRDTGDALPRYCLGDLKRPFARGNNPDQSGGYCKKTVKRLFQK